MNLGVPRMAVLTILEDDSTFQFYDRKSTAINQTFFTNDRNYRQTYKGIEISGTKRMSNRWQMLPRYSVEQSKYRSRNLKSDFVLSSGAVFDAD